MLSPRAPDMPCRSKTVGGNHTRGTAADGRIMSPGPGTSCNIWTPIVADEFATLASVVPSATPSAAIWTDKAAIAAARRAKNTYRNVKTSCCKRVASKSSTHRGDSHCAAVGFLDLVCMGKRFAYICWSRATRKCHVRHTLIAFKVCYNFYCSRNNSYGESTQRVHGITYCIVCRVKKSGRRGDCRHRWKNLMRCFELSARRADP